MMFPPRMLRPPFAKRSSSTDGGQDLPYSYDQLRISPAEGSNSRFAPAKKATQHHSPIRWLVVKGVQGGLLLALGALALYVLIWRHLFAVNEGEIMSSSAGRSGAENTFTVRMNTFRRNDLLKKSVEHFATCDCVSQIQVVWSDQENSPPSFELFKEEARAKVLFEVHDSNSLNHRFNVTSPLETPAVFSTDDDLLIPCGDLQFAFDAWQSSQFAMVGFTPRVVTHDKQTDRYSYRSWRVVRWNGVYNIILTKCCFLNRLHLETYVKEVPQHMLSYIDTNRNCEDIAMSMVVAKFFSTPPLWVKGKVKEIGGNGISGLGGHFEARSHCVDYFTEVFDGNPLLDTSMKVYPMHSGLLSWM